MSNIIQFETSRADIGLKARRPKDGPEQTLVQGFIEHIKESIISNNNQHAIFLEPQLATGFPDIVIVEYKASTFADWQESRALLKALDLKIIHHLHHVEKTTIEVLEQQLGIDKKLLDTSLARLHDSRLAYRRANHWRPYSIKRTFAIKRIIAIEAKLTTSGNAIKQAHANKWFASETYVLSSVLNPSSKVIQTSKKLGIGLYLHRASQIIRVLGSSISALPSCYGSWLFNEWIGRHLQTI